MNNEKRNFNVNRGIKISLLGAIAVILMYFDFPVTIFPWLKIDLSDVPALMGAFAFGPMAGVAIEGLKNLLILVVKGTGT
ncbi:MAG: ECF transporter S component, partial [Clostridium sp.]